MKTTFSYYEIFTDDGKRVYQYMINNVYADHEQLLSDKMDNVAWDKGLDRNSLYSEFIKTV